jgi:flagellar hook-associated protein 1 FlgK
MIQARAMREEECGVSLDEEAAKLLQFQRSYEAAARLVTVLDDMTKEMINLLR